MAIGSKTGLGAVLIVSGMALSTNALAGAESGLYIGGGVGSASIEASDTSPQDGATLDFDESDAAYKLLVGYNFGIVPLVNLAIEGGYVDFGAPEGTVSGENVSYETSGFNGYGLAGVNLGPVMVFAKMGMIAWDTDSELGSTASSDSGTDTAWGAGIQFQLLSIGFRAEYERYDISELDALDMVSASVTYTF